MVTLVVKAAGLPTGQITSQVILSAQIINALMGIMLTAIIWAYIRSIPIDNDPLKAAAFALTALNPNLIGINAQATNDTLAILLSTLAIISARSYLRREKGAVLAVCMICICLGLAAKTNVVVAAFAIMASLLAKWYAFRQRFMLVSAILFLAGIMILSVLNPLTQYWTNRQKYGAMVLMNRGVQPYPFPDFLEKSYYARPGITSILDGIFTFKYGSLLRYPRLTNAPFHYPAHRTSLWTQIYAHAQSIHFDNWPPSWGSHGTEYFSLTRAVFILALLPTAVLIIGAAGNLSKFLAGLFNKSSSSLRAMDYGIFTILFWSHIAFIMIYSLLYRDFSNMKAIFIFPALISFNILFIDSGDALQRTFNHKGLAVLFLSISAFLVILYCVDTYTLFIHLHSLPQ